MARPLEIGTISFARCGKRMALQPKERVRLIAAAMRAYRPDLLVTSGFALHSYKQVWALLDAVQTKGSRALIVAEVHHAFDEEQQGRSRHAMCAITGDGHIHGFGPQWFATSAEAQEEERLERFRGWLPQRIARLEALRLFALCCGELNIVRGRHTPRFIDAAAERAIMAADIIVNPTHDRMGNAGTLIAKRQLLSQAHPDGRPRLYVSCSNWEVSGADGRVQHPSATLHTVYRCGEPLVPDVLADGSFGFVYRRWRTNL